MDQALSMPIDVTPYSAACSFARLCLNADRTEGEFTAVAMTSPMGSRLSSREAERRKQLANAWDFVQGREPDTPDQLRTKVEYARHRATIRDWSYRGGSTDCRLMFVMLDLAIEHGGYTVRQGVRGLAERVGVTAMTISASLKRLADRGLITRKPRVPGQTADAWDIRLVDVPRYDRGRTVDRPDRGSEAPAGDGNDDFPIQGNTGTDSPVQRSNHLAFHRKALGETAGTILCLDWAGPVTVKEVAREANLHDHQVRRALSKLVEYGLAELSGTGRGRKLRAVIPPVTPERLDEIARECGTVDYLERLAEKHERERETDRRSRGAYDRRKREEAEIEAYAAYDGYDFDRAAVEHERERARHTGSRNPFDPDLSEGSRFDLSPVPDPADEAA